MMLPKNPENNVYVASFVVEFAQESVMQKKHQRTL